MLDRDVKLQALLEEQLFKDDCVITERKIESVDDDEAQKRRVADIIVSLSIDAADALPKCVPTKAKRWTRSVFSV